MINRLEGLILEGKGWLEKILSRAEDPIIRYTGQAVREVYDRVKGFARVAGYAVSAAVGLNLAPYFLPYSREILIWSIEGDNWDKDPARRCGGYYGIIAGVLTLDLQVVLYLYAAFHGHPEVMAGPFLTNLVTYALLRKKLRD